MSDLIDRQAAIDKINERQRKLIYCFGFDNDMVKIMNIAKSIISAIPPAQHEIIRCKDCKYSDENWRRVSVRWLPCMDIRVPSNWFCGSAERREE